MKTSNNQRNKFTEAFKREAIALVTEQGYSYAQAAESLGIRENYIHHQEKQLSATKHMLTLTTSECDELLRLRNENKRLKMEQEILKAASAFFAKEMN